MTTLTRPITVEKVRNGKGDSLVILALTRKALSEMSLKNCSSRPKRLS